MIPELDPGLVALFGSETRVSVLAVLAGASRPSTGYRVAKIARIQPIKVYAELRRLRKAGIVREVLAEGGRSGWELSAPDVRRLVGDRVRVSWSDDWFAGESERARRAQAIVSQSISWFDPSRYTPNPSVAARYAKQIERPLEKDDWPAGFPVSRKRK
ncbi:MAG: hypothetical protein L3K14_00600 [Thermoplasmata archaeon]|nr:hypothetical protein [Thermoplasmata archaeon]